MASGKQTPSAMPARALHDSLTGHRYDRQARLANVFLAARWQRRWQMAGTPLLSLVLPSASRKKRQKQEHDPAVQGLWKECFLGLCKRKEPLESWKLAHKHCARCL